MLCIEANDEWLVGRRYLSAESISLVIAGRNEHTNTEITERCPSSSRPEPPTLTDDRSADLLHHVPGLD
jgi:hypothetical protein